MYMQPANLFLSYKFNTKYNKIYTQRETASPNNNIFQSHLVILGGFPSI